MIDEVIVDPDFSRLGMGKHLMQLAFSWAKHQQADDMELVVWEGNVAAKKFYDDLGFRTLHRRLIHKL